MPLLNILFAGVHESAAVIDIVDCTKHLEDGGKKDAEHIADLFLPEMDKLDPTKTLFDTIIFDGAANVQKGAQVIAATHPTMFAIHGAEHVVSLFFADLMKIWQLKLFQQGYCRGYHIFGLGSMHQPYAMFQKQSQMFNNGKKIGLL